MNATNISKIKTMFPPKSQLKSLTKVSGPENSMEGTYRAEIQTYDKMNDIEKRMQDLREQRKQIEKEYQAKLDTVQKEIDELDYKNKGFDRFVGHYVRIYVTSADTTYMYVEKLNRRVDGAEFVGAGFSDNVYMMHKLNHLVLWPTLNASIHNIDDVKIITEEEFVQELGTIATRYIRYIKDNCSRGKVG